MTVRICLFALLLPLAACMGAPRGSGAGASPGSQDRDAWRLPTSVKMRDTECYYTPRVPACGETTTY